MIHSSQAGRRLTWGQEETKVTKRSWVPDSAEKREAATLDVLCGRRPRGEAPWNAEK